MENKQQSKLKQPNTLQKNLTSQQSQILNSNRESARYQRSNQQSNIQTQGSVADFKDYHLESTDLLQTASHKNIDSQIIQDDKLQNNHQKVVDSVIERGHTELEQDKDSDHHELKQQNINLTNISSNNKSSSHNKQRNQQNLNYISIQEVEQLIDVQNQAKVNKTKYSQIDKDFGIEIDESEPLDPGEIYKNRLRSERNSEIESQIVKSNQSKINLNGSQMMPRLIQSGDIDILKQENSRLKQSVLMFVEKLENFISKTQTLKNLKRNKLLKQHQSPRNEILLQKQKELDQIVYKITSYKKQIAQVKDFFQNESQLFEKMLNFEDKVKSQSKQIMTLQLENQSLKKIYDNQHVQEETLAYMKDQKQLQIENIKDEIHALQQSIKQFQDRIQAKDRSIQVIHENIIAYETRCRQMFDIVREHKLKKQAKNVQQNDQKFKKQFNTNDQVNNKSSGLNTIEATINYDMNNNEKQLNQTQTTHVTQEDLDKLLQEIAFLESVQHHPAFDSQNIQQNKQENLKIRSSLDAHSHTNSLNQKFSILNPLQQKLIVRRDKMNFSPQVQQQFKSGKNSINKSGDKLQSIAQKWAQMGSISPRQSPLLNQKILPQTYKKPAGFNSKLNYSFDIQQDNFVSDNRRGSDIGDLQRISLNLENLKIKYGARTNDRKVHSDIVVSGQQTNNRGSKLGKYAQQNSNITTTAATHRKQNFSLGVGGNLSVQNRYGAGSLLGKQIIHSNLTTNRTGANKTVLL
eukprot:403373190